MKNGLNPIGVKPWSIVFTVHAALAADTHSSDAHRPCRAEVLSAFAEGAQPDTVPIGAYGQRRRSIHACGLGRGLHRA